jgi:tripartite-type tricarboxylate transporter receptor subunit TctC
VTAWSGSRESKVFPWWLSVGFIGAWVAGAAALAQVPEQAYPHQMVRVIVPFSPGSVTDILARTIAEKLAESWNQTVIVDNRPGVPGIASAAKSTPDGLTLMLTSNGHTVIGSLNRNPGFDPVADFVAVTPIASVPFVLVATPSLGVNSIKELIELARAQPGTLNMALPGLGSAASIASELFRQEAGIELTVVPYKGPPEAHASVVRGDAHIFFSAANVGMELIAAGKVRPLAVSTRERLPKLPDLPTLAESGLRNFDYDAWFGVLAPAGTPRPIIAKLNRDIAAVLDMPDVKTRMERQGIEPRRAAPDRFDAIIRADTARYGPLFRESDASRN